MRSADFLKLADEIAADIRSGQLKPGERLQPQRHFAFERKIATSTAGRVYGELLRRGLVVGEVGRGTFVAGLRPHELAASAEAHEQRIDLEFNFPILPDQSALISDSLRYLFQPNLMEICQRPVTARRLGEAREVTASFLAADRWKPDATSITFTGSGRQAIAVALAATVPAGGRLGVEAITYPLVKSIAARLGITLIPISMDRQGMEPDAISKAHEAAALSALYIQPILQNPLGISMLPRRQEQIVQLGDRLGIAEPPLSALAPERCVTVDSLSKRIAPGIGFGFLCTPPALQDKVNAAIRSGGWSVTSFALEAGRRLMSDGTAKKIEQHKCSDARLRQQMAERAFEGYDIEADPRAYHLWLKLPEQWRSDAFAAAAANQGIAITPSSFFTVVNGHAPPAVRLALAAPPLESLGVGLATLAALLRSGPDEVERTE
jgi:DNA-binding transcriptional MocR family regulator